MDLRTGEPTDLTVSVCSNVINFYKRISRNEKPYNHSSVFFGHSVQLSLGDKSKCFKRKYSPLVNLIMGGT